MPVNNKSKHSTNENIDLKYRESEQKLIDLSKRIKADGKYLDS